MNTIIYNCGRTIHAEALRKHFRCDEVIYDAPWPTVAEFHGGNALWLVIDDVECIDGRHSYHAYSLLAALHAAKICDAVPHSMHRSYGEVLRSRNEVRSSITRDFLSTEVVANVTDLVDQLRAFSTADVPKNTRWCGLRVQEYWAVSSYLAEKLRQYGETVADVFNLQIWCCAEAKNNLETNLVIKLICAARKPKK
jgi:hypothetical protein